MNSIKPIIVSIILLLTIHNVLAQEEAQGYFLDLNRDTTFVTFLIPLKLLSGNADYFSIQFGVKYFDLDSNEEKFLSPKEVSEIFFNVNGNMSRMIALPNVLRLESPPRLSGVRVFLKIEIDGHLQLFKYYHYDYFAKNLTIYDILVKNVTDQLQVFPFYFRRDLTKYLADCPELVNKIKNKTYKARDLHHIVFEYNQNCIK
jgi:hypothetical protein